MKKLLLILLCLIVVTGCGNEVEQQPNKPNIKQEEVETNKYITIKIEVDGKCARQGKNDCNIKDYKIENDKNNIFKDLDLNNMYYCDSYGDYCNKYTNDKVALKEIYNIAIKNNLNLIPDYRYLVNDKYKTTREIILKPLDEFKWESKINLNENVLVTIYTETYNEFEDRCMYTDEENGKQTVATWCDREQGGIKKKISDDLIEQINSTPGRVYKSTFIDELGYEEIVINELYLGFNPRFATDNTTNIFNKKDYIKDIQKINNYNPFNIGPGISSNPTKTESKMLDEKLCKEYKLTCDRW